VVVDRFDTYHSGACKKTTQRIHAFEFKMEYLNKKPGTFIAWNG